MKTDMGLAPVLFCLALPMLGSALRGAPITPEGRDFFERKIRPVLVAECYECHGGQKQKAGLRLDSRPGWQQGGDSGVAIVPGDPAKSPLLAAIKHTDPDLKMPDKAPKLSAAVIADFERWIAMGAPDPRDDAAAEPAVKPAWSELFAARKTWWSLQPVSNPAPPPVADGAWSAHPVDRFLLAKMEAKGLAPAADADPQTVLRRLTFVLTGLPPTPAELESFAADCARDRPAALAAHTARLLGSPRFGEHWARHWMDLVRYAETHGSEGDPAIPEAYRYRDYLIRAFNADVPLDQIIREHVAGDLLERPRLNPAGFNESILGTAHFRFVEHGFQPVDTLDDQVKAVDSQIDVVSKAFQGLTISCARCHDHKFDAVSQRDYTALYGIFASVRPAQVTIDTAEVLERNRSDLDRLHRQIRSGLARAWLATATTLAARLGEQAARAPAQRERRSALERELKDLRAGQEEAGGDRVFAGAIEEAAGDPASPLHLWARLGALDDARFAAAWSALAAELREKQTDAQRFNRENFRPLWDLAGDDYQQWFPEGTGLGAQPVRPGEFAITTAGDRIIEGLAPAGAFTPRLSDKHHGLLTSPRFKIDSDHISVRALGGGGAMVRVIVDHYPLPQNPIFPKSTLNQEKSGWIRLDTAYRKGSSAYLEFGTRNDLTRPIDDRTKKPGPAPVEGRSFFGVDAIVAHEGKNTPRAELTALLPLLEGAAPATAAELAGHYQRTLAAAVDAWRAGALTEPQRALLDFFARHDFLPTALAELPELRPTVAEYRRLEAEVPVPRRAPGVLETMGHDAPLFARGDHLKPGEIVPRGYLQVIAPEPYRTALSGRLELAHAIGSAKNPLTARVMANRAWQWVFGAGLVPTVDNFGRMGETPAHPELLDFLAVRLVERGWSLKDLVRFLVTTRAFQMGSTPSVRAAEVDPANALLSHRRVRRLEAESIRDSLLAVAGELQDKMFGPSVGSNAPRRSVYLQVRRTRLDPFLQTFDAPAPFSTLGRRDATNVPAQSLLLLNSQFVTDRAATWAKTLVADRSASAETRVRGIFLAALGRAPRAEELAAAADYLGVLADEHRVAPEAMLTSARVWQDLAHAIFNLKEFIYVR